MLIDSHCHLNMVKHTTPDTLIANAKTQGVDYFLNVAVDLEHFPIVRSIAEQFDNVFASAGIHPNTSPHHLTCEVHTLTTLANHPKVIAIGETGLDYYRSHGDLTWQHERFRTHIQAAKQIGKPLIIHSREAASDTLQILREEEAAQVGGVMHCFVDDWETARQAMELGFYISFSGIVTFKTATALQEVAKKVPLDRMLVETDSPYLAPVPHRGQTNQPAYVRHVAECIAKLRHESLDTLAQVTTENFCRLFKLAV